MSEGQLVSSYDEGFVPATAPHPNAPMYCQCSNPQCGALLKMGSSYQAGQVVNCPECDASFMISPESPQKIEETNPQYGFGYTPENQSSRYDARYVSGSMLRKEALFQFPSPSHLSTADMDLLQIPDSSEMLDTPAHTHLRNMQQHGMETNRALHDSLDYVGKHDRYRMQQVKEDVDDAPSLDCRYCSKVFKKAGRLLTHERKHTGERPFSCNECTKSFRDSAALEGHVARQHRQQPFHCQVCEKGFSSQRQLGIHARVHSGEKPYDCTICGRKFSQEGNLHTHIRRHMANFGLEPLSDPDRSVQHRKCKLCAKVITSESDLKNHVKYHVKVNDLHRLREFTRPCTIWPQDDDEDMSGSRKQSTASSVSMDESDISRRESFESTSSSVSMRGVTSPINDQSPQTLNPNSVGANPYTHTNSNHAGPAGHSRHSQHRLHQQHHQHVQPQPQSYRQPQPQQHHHHQQQQQPTHHQQLQEARNVKEEKCEDNDDEHEDDVEEEEEEEEEEGGGRIKVEPFRKLEDMPNDQRRIASTRLTSSVSQSFPGTTSKAGNLSSATMPLTSSTASSVPASLSNPAVPAIDIKNVAGDTTTPPNISKSKSNQNGNPHSMPTSPRFNTYPNVTSTSSANSISHDANVHVIQTIYPSLRVTASDGNGNHNMNSSTNTKNGMGNIRSRSTACDMDDDTSDDSE